MVKKIMNTLLVTCLLGYYKIKPSCRMHPNTNAHITSYDGETKWMYFLIGHGELLEKYNGIRENVNTRIKLEFDSEPVYNKKFV